MNNNTRKYARTLDEAFPRGMTYACSIERPEGSWEKKAGIALAIAIGIILAGFLVDWWSS